MLYAQSIAHFNDDHGLLVGRLESVISPITDRVDHVHPQMNEGAENGRAEMENHANRLQMLEQMIAVRETQIERIQGMLASLTAPSATGQGPRTFDLTPPGTDRGCFAGRLCL